MPEYEQVIQALTGDIVTQAELSRRAGVNRDTLRRWANDANHLPSLRLLRKVASALDEYLIEHPDAAARLADLSTPAAA